MHVHVEETRKDRHTRHIYHANLGAVLRRPSELAYLNNPISFDRHTRPGCRGGSRAIDQGPVVQDDSKIDLLRNRRQFTSPFTDRRGQSFDATNPTPIAIPNSLTSRIAIRLKLFQNTPALRAPVPESSCECQAGVDGVPSRQERSAFKNEAMELEKQFGDQQRRN